MAFLNFGRRIKHRQFDYRPRYYDPDKEELENRLDKYSGNKPKGDTELTKARIRGGFRRKYRVSDDYSKKSNRRSNVILIFTILGLLLLTVIFISEYLPKIIATFE